jgi:hypothetical protein
MHTNLNCPCSFEDECAEGAVSACIQALSPIICALSLKKMNPAVNIMFEIPIHFCNYEEKTEDKVSGDLRMITWKSTN